MAKAKKKARHRAKTAIYRAKPISIYLDHWLNGDYHYNKDNRKHYLIPYDAIIDDRPEIGAITVSGLREINPETLEQIPKKGKQ